VPDHIQDKVILITGAGGGFGRLVAEKTAARGARIVACDIDEAGLETTVDAVLGAGGEIEAVRADVSRLADMKQVAQAAVARFGAIDVMVNNAGVMPLAFYADHAIAAEAWTRCIDVNFKGVLNGIIAVHDQMIDQGRGHIVNLSSIYGNYPVSGAAVYGATKAAVNFLSEALRQESRGRIKVTTIRPTGVPGTGLGAGVLNPVAVGGILGAGMDDFMQTFARIVSGEAPAELTDPEAIAYFSLAPEILADQIVFAIDQPWGVSISDLTVRASGDGYTI
jgi:NADP-dependent 3-hydroxy acid dehydrogenase YdfG